MTDKEKLTLTITLLEDVARYRTDEDLLSSLYCIISTLETIRKDMNDNE